MEGSTNVFRVTVRGRFDGLSDRARRSLAASAPEHDIFESAYSPEGTLAYDKAVDFFSLRYEMRAGGASAAEEAGELGLLAAEDFLRTMSFGYRGLKVNVVDMAAMWAKVERG